MRVTVFGIGYVGLVQGAVLAEVGHDVLCVDINASKVENLQRGIIPIYEPGLEELIVNNQRAGRLNFTTDAVEGIKHGEVQFIAVGTPPDADGAADMKYVLTVAQSIAEHMQSPCIIVDKSTVPVGTADRVRQCVSDTLAKRQRQDLTFDVVSNPEFLKEGSAVADCMRPDRIIIGTASSEAEAVMRELYAPFNRNHEKIMVMDVRSAELTKYAANCMLASKISFMNEMAGLADLLGADIEMVRQGIGADPRIGYHFIYAGAGYGGSCFPKDVQALIRTADQLGFDAHLLKAVEARNHAQKSVLFNKIQRHFGGELAGKVFALWGLSFKPNTDDLRDAPSRTLMEALWAAGASVQAYDPEAMPATRLLYPEHPQLTLCETKEAALNDADALLIVTEWSEFKAPDFLQIKQALKQPVIFDGRNLFEPARMRSKGLSYYAIGRN